MKGKYESLLREVRAGLKLARASLERRWAAVSKHGGRASDYARQALGRAVRASQAGWVSFRDSWTKTDWLVGIRPLPPEMTGHLAAAAIVVGLVTTSLVYDDYLQRAIALARLIPSGEHPSQQNSPAQPNPAAPAEPVEPPASVPEARPAPVPESAKPEIPLASADPIAEPQFPRIGEPFVDRFDVDQMDEERWFISDGWSNGDFMDSEWRRSQLSIGPAGLTMTMARLPEGSSKKLASAEIHTNEFFRYGYFEVRMRVPRDPGIVIGVFTYANQDGETRPHEIDIEIPGRNTRMLEATIHEDGKPTHRALRLPFDASEGFHTYGFDWQPDAVRWYADGKLIHEEKGPVVRRLTRPQQFIVHFWASDPLKHWLGPLDVTRAPWKFDIACLAYSPSYSAETPCR